MPASSVTAFLKRGDVVLVDFESTQLGRYLTAPGPGAYNLGPSGAYYKWALVRAYACGLVVVFCRVCPEVLHACAHTKFRVCKGHQADNIDANAALHKLRMHMAFRAYTLMTRSLRDMTFSLRPWMRTRGVSGVLYNARASSFCRKQ